MIEVRNLSYTYTGAVHAALRGLEFGIQRGEIFGFLGPSGAGKSTTQKILIGLLNGYTGEVLVEGKSLPDWGSEFYEHIGVSFEQPNHFLKLTALENLRYFASLYGHSTHRPETLLARVGLQEDGDTLVSQYSKGMKGRLSIARALLPDPDILFLDEPTSGLDPVNARQIKELIEEQKAAGKTIFLTTHNMNVAETLCDRVAFLVDGEIRLIDAPRTLKLSHGKPVVQVEYSLNNHLEVQCFPLDTLGKNEAFFDLLRSAHLQTLHTLEASLEDIFIRVTGRRLE